MIDLSDFVQDLLSDLFFLREEALEIFAEMVPYFLKLLSFVVVLLMLLLSEDFLLLADLVA